MNFIKKFFIVFLVVAFAVGGFFSIKSAFADPMIDPVFAEYIDLTNIIFESALIPVPISVPVLSVQEELIADVSDLIPIAVSDPALQEELIGDVSDSEIRPEVFIIAPLSGSHLAGKVVLTANILTVGSFEQRYSVEFWQANVAETKKIGNGLHNNRDNTYSILWDTSFVKDGSRDIWAVISYRNGIGGIHTGNTEITDSNTSDKVAVVVDNTLPIITRLGLETVNLTVGDSYTDTGATALDNIDGDITASIVRSGTYLNTSTAGTYTIIYNVSDKAKNKAIEATRTINITASNNGGGNSGGSSSGSSGGHRRQPIAPPIGQVLGASTENNGVCSANFYLNKYIKFGSKNNDTTEVVKLQLFLNENLGTRLITDGNYGSKTVEAVNAFQTKYRKEVLTPWIPYGLQNNSQGTGYVYKTTKRWINLTKCPELNIAMPVLNS